MATPSSASNTASWPGLTSLGNAGPHGFSEILYAFTSGAATNGSAFAGLNANTPFYNLTLALAMFVGRYFVIVPVLAIAGSLAAKQIVPRSAGTLPTGGSLFVVFLVGVICIVGGLTFLPALSLGPVAEQLAMQPVDCIESSCFYDFLRKPALALETGEVEYLESRHRPGRHCATPRRGVGHRTAIEGARPKLKELGLNVELATSQWGWTADR